MIRYLNLKPILGTIVSKILFKDKLLTMHETITLKTLLRNFMKPKQIIFYS